MVMPTTRRGRFELYRARSANRARKYRKAYARASADPAKPGHIYTRRTFDWRAFGKQAPRSYPKNPKHVHLFPFAPGFWMLPPTFAQWGVPLWTNPWYSTHPENSHPRVPYLGYVLRRVQSIPRAREITKLPWTFAIEEVPITEFYPFDTYPSGRPSYASTLTG